MIVVEAGVPLTDQDFARIETEIGCAFPEDLRRFYAGSNGGRPIPNTFAAHGDSFAVHQFIPERYGARLETRRY